jgi:hypothetical protein
LRGSALEFLDPDRLAWFRERVAELADALADTPRGDYWAAVLAELES